MALSPKPGRLSARLPTLGGAGAIHVVSDLVYMECLVKPLALGDAALRAAYETYLDALDVVALTRAVCVRAAAVEAGCDAFVTGDQRPSGFPDIEVALITPDAEQTTLG